MSAPFTAVYVHMTFSFKNNVCTISTYILWQVLLTSSYWYFLIVIAIKFTRMETDTISAPLKLFSESHICFLSCDECTIKCFMNKHKKVTKMDNQSVCACIRTVWITYVMIISLQDESRDEITSWLWQKGIFAFHVISHFLTGICFSFLTLRRLYSNSWQLVLHTIRRSCASNITSSCRRSSRISTETFIYFSSLCML